MHPNANYRIWKKMIVARQRREFLGPGPEKTLFLVGELLNNCK
jgi:hypothetical protein